MPEIKLKTERLPTRCEVCHQADLFDAINNHCQRCSNLILHYQSHDQSILTRPISLLRYCQPFLRDFGLDIGQFCSITLMLFLSLIGSIIGSLIASLASELLFINIYKIMPLAISLGAMIGFLSLMLVARLVIRKTNIKLAPFIDLKIEILIKNSARKN
ncbi:MAG: hypothetical protein FD167_3975 [bacterium]|nr:MAG: hypothetical protein FD167_3975 [bacterium]